MVMIQESIGIIGSGPAGLITAHTLIKDGFTNTRLISRDDGPGGIWAKERVYPGLSLNNVYGQLRFSPLEMDSPPDAEKTGGRLTGEIMCDYMETFANKFLRGRIQYKTEVLNIKRAEGDRGWVVQVEDLTTNTISDLHFSKIVLCTGGCTTPNIPSYLSPHAAEASRYRGLVLHSSQFSRELSNILAVVKPTQPGSNLDTGSVVIIGCGKSAQDMSAYLANQGRKVGLIFDQLDTFIAAPKPVPACFRMSRFFSVMSPYITLRSRLQRFLHTTRLGSWFVRFVFNKLGQRGFRTFNVSADSPLRNIRGLFWDTRTSDVGVPHPTSFFTLATKGLIDLYAPARAVGYGEDGRSILLNNGQKIPADVVILATGYRSSWDNIFDEQTAEELGIHRHTLPTSALTNDEWASYQTLRNPPSPSSPPPPPQASSIYRGIIPANNIHKRDFAINGAIFSGNNGYVFEVVSHWISTYFLHDPLRLPPTPEAALQEAERHSAWDEKRFPGVLGLMNESIASRLHLWSWPQAVDELLEDMHLPSVRSGGSWFNWIFKVINSDEIKTLSEERKAVREANRRLAN